MDQNDALLTVARLLQVFPDGYSPTVCYAFTINYILGVGVLGMPQAFKGAGFLLGSIAIVCVTLISLLTVLMVAEATVLLERIEGHAAVSESQQQPGATGNLSDDQGSNVSRGSLGALETF